MTIPSTPDEDGEAAASAEGEILAAGADEPDGGSLLDRVARAMRRLWGDPPEEGQ